MNGDRSTRPGARIAPLLGDGDPSPVSVINPEGRSPFLLVGDHAGNAIPAALGSLGMREADRSRHIAWDIGVADLGEALAARLDAVFVRQTFSRLVIDCNRAPGREDAIPITSDGTRIAGNAGISDDDRGRRIAEIHEPYQEAIAQAIRQRHLEGRETLLVSLHSFTPRMGGVARPWQVGVLHAGGDERFADAVLDRLRKSRHLVVGDNEPYHMDETDHTVPHHAFGAGLPYVELEIRQDQLRDRAGVGRWEGLIGHALTAAMALRRATS